MKRQIPALAPQVCKVRHHLAPFAILQHRTSDLEGGCLGSPGVEEAAAAAAEADVELEAAAAAAAAAFPELAAAAAAAACHMHACSFQSFILKSVFWDVQAKLIHQELA